MLQNLHDNLKGVTAWVLVGLITIPFVFFGVDSLFLSGSSVEKVAEINGEKVSRLQLEQALQMRKQQLLDRSDEIDPSLLDDDLLREPVLQGLISQKAIEQASRENGMDVSPAVAYELLRETPDFQTDGQFDPQRYDYVVRRAGFSPTTHIDAVREDLLRYQFNQGVYLSSFATDKEVAQLAAITNEKRDYYYLTIKGDSVSSVEATDEDVQGYYEANSLDYMAPETVAVEYVDLNLNEYLEEVAVDAASLEEAYRNRVDTLRATDSKQVAHILLEAGQEALAAELQDKLAAGAEFAELAKAHSTDAGTAERGGDLGYVASGDLPEPMELAIASLEVGDVSGPVITDAGIHLINVVAVRETTVPELSELREELTANLKRQGAADLFSEAIAAMADSAYNASSLVETADLVGAELQQSAAFTRQGGEGIANVPDVVTAAFADEVLLEGYPSEVIEVGDDRAIVLRVTDHQEAMVQPLDTVREQVKQAFVAEKRRNLLEEKGADLIRRLEDGSSVEALAKAAGYDWQVSLDARRIGGDNDPEIRDFAFSLEQPMRDGVLTSAGDYVVLDLVKIAPGDVQELTAEQRNSLVASSRTAAGERETGLLTQFIVGSADVEIN